MFYGRIRSLLVPFLFPCSFWVICLFCMYGVFKQHCYLIVLLKIVNVHKQKVSYVQCTVSLKQDISLIKTSNYCFALS